MLAHIMGQISFALICLVLIFPGTASASAWSRENERLFVITRADYFTADLGNISVSGEDVDGRFKRFETNTYLEYGVTERFMIGGKVFYGTSWLTRGDRTETASGFNEVEGFLQYQVLRNERQAVAAKIAAGIPAGFSSGARPSIQSDGADIETSLLYGRSVLFRPIKIFVAAEAGYRFRTGIAADQVRVLTTLGLEPSKRLTLLIDTFTSLSAGKGDDPITDFDVFKVQPSIVLNVTARIGFQAGITEEVTGRNLDLGRTYFIGLRTHF